MALELNYFTCTLGHAALLKQQAPEAIAYKTVLHLIEYQSHANPDALAVGVAELLAGGSSIEADAKLTFAELNDMSVCASMLLADHVKARKKSDSDVGDSVVALLCPSNLEFVLAWLGLMRLGYTALFLAYVPAMP